MDGVVVDAMVGVIKGNQLLNGGVARRPRKRGTVTAQHSADILNREKTPVREVDALEARHPLKREKRWQHELQMQLVLRRLASTTA